MRVLHVLTSLMQRSGGPLRAVIDISAEAETFGLHSEIVGFGPVVIPDSRFPAELIHPLPWRGPKAYCYSREFGPWLEQNLCRFDGVILHGLWEYPQWHCARVCQDKGVPYACFPHGMLDAFPLKGHGLWKFLKKWLYWNWREKNVVQNARVVMFTTQSELVDSSRTFQFQNDSRLVTPYGVNASSGQRATTPRVEIHQPDERDVALFLGRLHPIKNIEFLIDSWAKSALPESWHLVIAGTGDPHYVASLLKQTQRQGLRDCVHFAGNVSGADKDYLLQRSKWLLLPSKHENFGVVVLEALHAGCSVALSTEVYLSERFQGFPEAPILPLTTDAWVGFMRTKMLSDEWRRTWQEHCSEILLREFLISSVASRWQATLAEIFLT